MARLDQIVDGNVAGEFFVDATCIDCATCRQLAPGVFGDGDGTSLVHAQPADGDARRRALMAMVACPVGAIGSRQGVDVHQAAASFPDPLDEEVSFCGFTSPSSYGAWSWFLRRKNGNVLVDSPRFNTPLANRLEALGGVRFMVLTHQDDVADHARFAARFGCERIIHKADAHGALKSAERVIDSSEPVQLDDDLLLIPTPGHTRGHCVLLHANRHLFSGDHLHWDEAAGRPHMWRNVCWYSWEEQLRSLRKLLPYRFEWLLPGHGMHHRASSVRDMAAAMQTAATALQA